MVYPTGMRVLFDESHSQSWSIDPTTAARIQPGRPSNSSYAKAAAALREGGLTVARTTDAEAFAPAFLADFDLLVIVHPCDPDYEATNGIGGPTYTAQELATLRAFVAAGKSVLIISEHEHRKYGSNLNDLLSDFALGFENVTISEHDNSDQTHPTWIFPGLAAPRDCMGITQGIHKVQVYRSGTCRYDVDTAVAVATPRSLAGQPGRATIVAATVGAGRIVTCADSDVFGDEFIDRFDHLGLWKSLIWWCLNPERRAGQARFDLTEAETRAGMEVRAGAGAGTALGAQANAGAEEEPKRTVDAQSSFKDPVQAVVALVDRIRPLQSGKDGKLATEHVSDAEQLLGDLRGLLSGAIAAQFEHQGAYFAALDQDLSDWAASGFQVADFGRSARCLRLQALRGKSRRAFVLGTMYLQNSGSTDFRLECAAIELPWPQWLSEIERNEARDPTFVPGRFLAHSRGYASECAVLFPEQMQVREKLPDEYGVIFCDREAARLRRHVAYAVEHFQLVLPPYMMRGLHDPAMVQDAFMLWDLCHNLSHFNGPLPYDRFKAKRRQPYWMYALEELRVDLHAFERIRAMTGRLGDFAEFAASMIVLDRMLRFTVFGSREYNYDALAGQIIYGQLARARDGARALVVDRGGLSLDWTLARERIAELKQLIDENEYAGAAVSLPNYWVLAHRMIREIVPANVQSRFGLDAGEEEADLLRAVHRDEFPLNQILNVYRRSLVDRPTGALEVGAWR